MKTTTKIISIVLSFVMVMLLCCSCGKATPEERFQTAIDNAQALKKSDVDVTINATITSAGVTMDMPMTMSMKSDVTDENNPVIAMDMTISMTGMQIAMNYYYKDGYAYTSVMGEKVKTAMSYDEMMEENSTGVENIFALEEDMLKSAEITENDDGTLSVKMNLDGTDYKDTILSMVDESIADVFGGGEITLDDSVIEMTIGKDDNVEKISMTVVMKMTVEGVETSVSYAMEFVYNEIGDDFEVELPADLDTYEEEVAE